MEKLDEKGSQDWDGPALGRIEGVV